MFPKDMPHTHTHSYFWLTVADAEQLDAQRCCTCKLCTLMVASRAWKQSSRGYVVRVVFAFDGRQMQGTALDLLENDLVQAVPEKHSAMVLKLPIDLVRLKIWDDPKRLACGYPSAKAGPLNKTSKRKHNKQRNTERERESQRQSQSQRK